MGPGNRGEPSVQSLVVDVRAAYDRHTGFVVLAPFVSAPVNFAPLLWAIAPAVVRLRRGARETERGDDGDGQNKWNAAHLVLLSNNAKLRVR